MNQPRDFFEDDNELKLNADELGKLWGVSRQRIYQLREEGMPMQARNTYSLTDVSQWLYQRTFDRQKVDPRTEETTRSQLNIAQREKVELENAKIRGQLVPVEDVAGVFNHIGTILATHLDGVGPRIAAMIADMDEPAEIQRMLFDEHRRIRATVAERIKQYAGEVGRAFPKVEPMPNKPKRKQRRKKPSHDGPTT